MPYLQLWTGRKGNTYRTIDRYVSQYIRMGGTGILVHKYIGPVEITADGDPTIPNLSGISSELTIQDLLFLENRDRKYSEDVYELRGVYTIADTDFDLSQFGLFMTADNYFITFHLNDIVDSIGRKLMPGDVLELPHQRDDLLLDETRPAINKFYVITDVNREAAGYSPTWYPHLLRVKVQAMTDSQEFADILNREVEDSGGQTLKDILSTYDKEINVNSAIQELAESNVKETNFETAHLYIAPNEDGQFTDPWIFAGDGEPPNGAELIGTGEFFPDGANEGEWFLRTDYEPNVLFRRVGNCWIRQEVDYRRTWSVMNRILETFINNTKEVNYSDATTHPEKVALSKAVLPKVDL